MKRILIIDEVHEVLINGLNALGYQVQYEPESTREELINNIEKYDGLVVRTKTTIDEKVLCKAVTLKFIARAGAGVDNIDTSYCDKHHIVYFNAGEANADAVGEQTIGMMLCLFANIVKADDEVRHLVWDREGNRGIELKGKTVGIIGYGNTGKAVAKKLAGFDVRVLAYDKYLINYSDQYVQESSLEQLMELSDVITLHVPLTAETESMINASFISNCKKKIFLLNLSRGKVVKLRDLMQSLKERRVIACALDVLENERLSAMTEEEKQVFDFLIKSSRTVLTPHVGGWTTESYEKISTILLQKIKQLKLE